MAAKLPQQYYPNFPGNGFCGTIPPAGGDDFAHLVSGNRAVNYVVPFVSYDDVNSPVSVTSFPEQFMVSECLQAVPQMSEVEVGICDYQQPVFVRGAAGEECSGLVPNIWPSANYAMPAAENWMQPQRAVQEAATEVKVGRYSLEERKDRILRYQKKRNQRNFNKTIKYACRKTLADRRVRIRGRFAKNVSEISEEEMPISTKHDAAFHQQNISFYQNGFQMMTHDEDDWLQTAVDNLVQLPYLGS